MPFASGGIVSGPTMFPMRGGRGLMGEAGPEAIMPLARGPDGRLGVRSAGGGGVNVTINVTTPDVAGFRKSQSQIAAEMGRLIAQGGRNR
jgi:phage-related minor tail protein